MKDTVEMPVVAGGAPCPGCGSAMCIEHFERMPHGEVTVDICYACRAIWFDHMESAQLAAGGVIALFKKIHAHRDDAYHTLPARLPCPRCRQTLKLTNDIVKSGRVSYHRCEANHGRLTTFFHFLREKKFVRNLTPKELDSIRGQLAEVRCSGCGGAVDITRDTTCGYCRAPLSVLDARAVEKALDELSERQARGADPARVADALHQALLVEPARARRAAASASNDTSRTGDLVLSGIAALVIGFLK